MRLHLACGHAGIQQGRVFLEPNVEYDGWVWVKPESGLPDIELRVTGAKGEAIASCPLKPTGRDWQELAFRFTNPRREEQASVEIAASEKAFCSSTSFL